MNKKVAIIDLGTNTCNLLIAGYDKNGFSLLYQGKEVVNLGKNGIDKNLLTEEGLARAIQSIRKHKERINSFHVSDTVAIATSAIREASNKNWFQQEVKNETGLDLQIISGDKEAGLIFKGVKLAFDQIEDHSLILDIGGGSNEFILANGGYPIWKESFPLGMARIIEQIPPSDPITENEILRMNSLFEARLSLLWEQMKDISVSVLIGCSGAFDTIADLIDQTNAGTKTRIKQEITIDDFYMVYERLIYSTIGERGKMKGMEPIRIEMIVPAVIFIKLVIEKLKIYKILQTDFALREGALYERIFS